MRLVKFSFFLIFLVACTVDYPNIPPMMDNPSLCNVDADCTCGGIDTESGDCFVGNKLYASRYVDFSKVCPDFCTGIAGNLETKCIDNVCRNVPLQMRACTEEAKLCPDGSAVGRVGPNCEFAPCPGEECSTDADCVPAECCHASACVPESQAPDCGGIMCTMDCQPDTLDCGGKCVCENGECNAVFV